MRALRLDEDIDTSGERMGQLIALDDALTDLAKLHPRQSEIIELRFFGGLSVEEDGGTAQSVTRNRDARLAHRQSLASRGTQSDR